MSKAQRKREVAESTTYRHAWSRRMIAAVTLWFRSFAVGSLNGQLRFFPRFPAAGNIPKLFKTQRLHDAGGDACPVPTAAINSCGLVLIEFFHSLAQFRNEDVTRAGNMSLLPFTGGTHIENLQ